MRKFTSFITIFAMMILTVNCQAALDYREIPFSQAFGDKAIAFGDWYDTSGNLVLKIGSDYTINGHKIISVGYTGDTVAFYKIRVEGEKNYRDIELQTFGSYEDTHGMLIINNTAALRHTSEPKYFESIGGIYLGMSKSKVMEIYGEPLSAEDNHQRKTSTWTYNGFEIFFNYNVVSSITIYSGGDRRFDTSGLSASSSQADFERKYEKKFSRRGNLDIGHGEVIVLRDDKATLQFLTPGFVL